MEKGINKDWMDAVREQCLSDGTTPAPSGWEALGARMRRAAARRRAMLSAAIALPVLALLLWSPWRDRPVPSTPMAQTPFSDSTSLLPDRIVETALAGRSRLTDNARPVIPDLIGDSARMAADRPRSAAQIPTGDQAATLQEESDSPPSSNPVRNEDEVSEKTVPSSKTVPVEDEVPAAGILWAQADPKPRHRTRVSIGLRAGADPARREATVSMQSAPYLAALNFLNTTDPSLMPRVKSNTSNTQEISATANAFFPVSSAGNYSHDLPLSLGLSLRVDLTPRLGLESGLEYTYLHSVEEFAGSRLNQRLHFVGIPVRLDASLWTNGGFGFYAGVGGKMEKCVAASLGRVACEEPRLQWSAEAFAGVRYQISSRMHLYFQPALSYYFTKTDLPTYRTEHPLGVSLHAGIRFGL